MESIDRRFILLQFQIEIYQNNGNAFQSFFEKIMRTAYDDFQTIRPLGQQGDRGNDGYRPNKGIYYQAYAPVHPEEKDTEAARKFEKNFKDLKKYWNSIATIKAYYFVFNDKYAGSSIELERTKAELSKRYKKIKFSILFAKDLEKIFFTLNPTQMESIGFDIDYRNIIHYVRNQLTKIEIELDRGNVNFALRALENIKDIITAQKEKDILLEYEILEAKALQKAEKVEKARKKYESISKKYPRDPRAFLLLAEIYLNKEDYAKNSSLLKKAKQISSNYWLLELEKLIRKYQLKENIDISNIDPNKFPKDRKVKSSFYRIYSLFIERSGDIDKAFKFVEQAINYNPDKFNNYDTKLAFWINKLINEHQKGKPDFEFTNILKEIDKIQEKFNALGALNHRNHALLNIKRAAIFFLQKDDTKFSQIAKETFQLFIQCYFDYLIDRLLTNLLYWAVFPKDDFERLLTYLQNSEKPISNDLAKALLLQFIFTDNLFDKGKVFFEKIGKNEFVQLVKNLKNNDYDKILPFFEEDTMFGINFFKVAKKYPELRRKIIQILPNDGSISKEILFLLLNSEKGNIDEAFSILKNINLSNLSYAECKSVLEVAQQKKAWDFAIVILKKLIEKEKNEHEKLRFNLQLFTSYLNLKKYCEVIEIGESLLNQHIKKNILNLRDKEILLSNTIIACIERGKVDENNFKKAREILEKYKLRKDSFEFKVGIETEVYICNNEIEKALQSLIEGVKIKKVFSPEEYAKLYYVFAIKIADKISLNIESLSKIQENTFVKLKDRNRWYFIGNNNELDAIKITKSDRKYSLFIYKKRGDKIIFKNKYSSEKQEDVVENILTIEKYVLWQTVHNFQELSKEGILHGVQVIELPQKNGKIDTQYLRTYMEDMDKNTKPFFTMYCEKQLPLAMLTTTEGDLTKAIGRIRRENKGYINFSTGNPDEFEQQQVVAKRVINKKIPFYIDGTSAFFLSEAGLFRKIYPLLPNLKIPQSVINFLINVVEMCEYRPNIAGHMSYFQGKIIFTPVEKIEWDLRESNFKETVRLLESKPENIEVISPANKIDCFSEKKVKDELVDACILSQKFKTPILTEDFLYLKMNEIETKKKAPEYFSALSLIKILYESKKVSFDEYLSFFAYLSLYRFRFLSIDSKYLEKTVFGDGQIKTVTPENIKKLNFSLTLSNEYGVPFKEAFAIIKTFLLQALLDTSLLFTNIEQIFIEIIDAFPIGMDKKTLGKMLLQACSESIRHKTKFILLHEATLNEIYSKIKRLIRTVELFDAKTKFLILPK